MFKIPGLGRLRQENFELDVSPAFTARHYIKGEKKNTAVLDLYGYLEKHGTRRAQHELHLPVHITSLATARHHKAATVGSVILYCHSRKHRLMFDQLNKQNPGLQTPLLFLTDES